MPGDLEIVFGHLQRLLHGTQLDVIASGLCEQRQQHAAAVLLGNRHARIGSFHLTAHPAPQIQLPARNQIALPKVVGRFAGIAGRVIQTLGTVARATVAGIQT
ncbi:hypothetical protein PS623_04765 [Pseudomonas fluorescens]|nr:hypothetical protein PS623_04765 [Pseudomonas fluorescens]